MNAKLTTRDISVILDVYKYRYLSGSQIEKLHFPSTQTMWRRIRALLDLGCLKSFTVPSIPERIFYLDKKGAEIAAIELSVDIADLGWQRHTRQPKDYYFLRHFLAINDFCILLTTASRKTDLTLLGFIPEYIGEQTKEGHVKKHIRDRVNDLSHTPDAVFSLEKAGNAALFFLEIDRGGEVVADPEKGLLKAVVFYLHYWCSRNWLRYQKDFAREFKTFRTLIITTSKARVQHLREATGDYQFHDSHAKRFLWATTLEQATKDWIFEAIWRSLDMHDQTLYRIS
jgi:DNA-binding Lrp family transcriptional regulator